MPNLTVARVKQSDRGIVFVGWVDPENPPLELNFQSVAVMQPTLCQFERLPVPPNVPREQSTSAVGGGTSPRLVWTS